MHHAHKDGKNPHFHSTYATLSAVIDAVREPLTMNKIAYVQLPWLEGTTVHVETRLLHASGEWLAATVSSGVKDTSPQVVGSAISYLRRYGLQAVCGIGAEDDDGEATRQVTAPRPQAPQAAQKVVGDDPSWATGQSAFVEKVKELGVDYEKLTDYLVSVGRERPSSMKEITRSQLLKALIPSEPFRAKYDLFVGA